MEGLEGWGVWGRQEGRTLAPAEVSALRWPQVLKWGAWKQSGPFPSFPVPGAPSPQHPCLMGLPLILGVALGKPGASC